MNKKQNKSLKTVLTISYIFIIIISSFIVFSEIATTNVITDYNSTKLAITKLENEKNQMELLGLRTEVITDYISLSRVYLDSGKYLEAEQTITKAEKTITSAYLLKKELPLLENNLYLANQSEIDVNNASILFQNSKKELLIGNYDGAFELITSSKQVFRQILEKHYSSLFYDIKKVRNDSSEFRLNSIIFDDLEKEYVFALDSLDIIKINNLEQKLTQYQNILLFFKNMEDSMNNFEEIEKRKSLLFSDIYMSTKSNIEQSKIKEFETDYNSFVKNYEFYKTSKEQILIIQNELDKSNKNDVHLANTYQLFDIIKKEYSKENYEKSEALSKELINNIKSSKSDSILSNKFENSNSWLNFLKSNINTLIMIFMFLLSITLVLYNPLKNKYYKSRRSQLLKKIDVNINLVKKTQRKYFKEKILSKENYEFFMDKYQEKIVSARESLFILEKLEKKDIGKKDKNNNN